MFDTGLGALLIAFLMVGFQNVKVALASPVVALKDELLGRENGLVVAFVYCYQG